MIETNALPLHQTATASGSMFIVSRVCKFTYLLTYLLTYSPTVAVCSTRSWRESCAIWSSMRNKFAVIFSQNRGNCQTSPPKPVTSDKNLQLRETGWRQPTRRWVLYSHYVFTAGSHICRPYIATNQECRFLACWILSSGTFRGCGPCIPTPCPTKIIFIYNTMLNFIPMLFCTVYIFVTVKVRARV